MNRNGIIPLQELTLKVCRLEDSRIIANTSTHEEVTSLQLLEFGYLVVIGREDGHVVTMKLMDPHVIGYEAGTHCNLAERQNWVKINLTRKHSSRMRTNRSSGLHSGRVYLPPPGILPHPPPLLDNLPPIPPKGNGTRDTQ